MMEAFLVTLCMAGVWIAPTGAPKTFLLAICAALWSARIATNNGVPLWRPSLFGDATDIATLVFLTILYCGRTRPAH